MEDSRGRIGRIAKKRFHGQAADASALRREDACSIAAHGRDGSRRWLNYSNRAQGIKFAIRDQPEMGTL